MPTRCRQHDQAIVVTNDEDAEEWQGKMANLWDIYWGFDLVRAGGLLDKAFTQLKIPETSWPGLKVLPEVITWLVDAAR